MFPEDPAEYKSNLRTKNKIKRRKYQKSNHEEKLHFPVWPYWAFFIRIHEVKRGARKGG